MRLVVDVKHFLRASAPGVAHASLNELQGELIFLRLVSLDALYQVEYLARFQVHDPVQPGVVGTNTMSEVCPFVWYTEALTQLCNQPKAKLFVPCRFPYSKYWTFPKSWHRTAHFTSGDDMMRWA